jgi:hypothetical protein
MATYLIIILGYSYLATEFGYQEYLLFPIVFIIIHFLDWRSEQYVRRFALMWRLFAFNPKTCMPRTIFSPDIVKSGEIVFIYFLLSWITLIGFGKQEEYWTASFVKEGSDVYFCVCIDKYE